MKQFKFLKATDASSVILLNTIFEGLKRIVNSDGINDYFIRLYFQPELKTLPSFTQTSKLYFILSMN